MKCFACFWGISVAYEQTLLLFYKLIPAREPWGTHWLKCLRKSRKKTLMQHRVALRGVGRLTGKWQNLQKEFLSNSL